ncbi:hypothetical protein H6503_03935 [Candidatus Woesearchaeota archaeon]|nr:hypothetical protein [Candidatus Woesearchaeota archaeon]
MEQDLIHVRKKRAFELGFILYFLVVFLLAFVTDTSLPRMFLASLPILLSLIALVFLIEYDYISMQIVIGIPVIFSGLFYAIWKSGMITELSKVSGATMTVLDLFMTYGIFIMIFLIWGNKGVLNRDRPRKKIHPVTHETKIVEVPVPGNNTDISQYLEQIARSEQERDYYKSIVNEYKDYVENSDSKNAVEDYDSTDYLHKYIHELMSQIKKAEDPGAEQDAKFEKKKRYYRGRIQQLNKELDAAKQALKITKENFVTNLRSIEDKCKAINFVVGRVYSDKNGGSKKVREILNINRILYNTFSAITKDWKDENSKYLMYVLALLKKKLSLYLVPERILFKVEKAKDSSVERDQAGNSIVLEVLSKNDKDPVKEYHAEATEICNNLIKFLRDNY